MLNRLVNGTRGLPRFLVVAALATIVGVATMSADCATAKGDDPVVVLETTKGNITIELYAEKAPKTVENFLWYVDNEFYDGLIFHRVMPNFMIQGGGFTKDLVKKDARDPIKNEANNGLKNDRGTIAMARIPDPHSATCQFYINLKNNNPLNFRDDTPRGYGYAVFGAVIDGIDVIDEIATVKTVKKEGMDNVPATPVIINKAYRVKESKKEEAKKAEESDKETADEE